MFKSLNVSGKTLSFRKKKQKYIPMTWEVDNLTASEAKSTNYLGKDCSTWLIKIKNISSLNDSIKEAKDKSQIGEHICNIRTEKRLTYKVNKENLLW